MGSSKAQSRQGDSQQHLLTHGLGTFISSGFVGYPGSYHTFFGVRNQEVSTHESLNLQGFPRTPTLHSRPQNTVLTHVSDTVTARSCATDTQAGDCHCLVPVVAPGSALPCPTPQAHSGQQLTITWLPLAEDASWVGGNSPWGPLGGPRGCGPP